MFEKRVRTLAKAARDLIDISSHTDLLRQYGKVTQWVGHICESPDPETLARIESILDDMSQVPSDTAYTVWRDGNWIGVQATLKYVTTEPTPESQTEVMPRDHFMGWFAVHIGPKPVIKYVFYEIKTGYYLFELQVFGPDENNPLTYRVKVACRDLITKKLLWYSSDVFKGYSVPQALWRAKYAIADWLYFVGDQRVTLMMFKIAHRQLSESLYLEPLETDLWGLDLGGGVVYTIKAYRTNKLTRFYIAEYTNDKLTWRYSGFSLYATKNSIARRILWRAQM